MESKEFTNEKLDNKEQWEEKEKGIVEWTKKSLNKLFSAILIAGVISWSAVAKEQLNGYDEVKELTDNMKAWEKIELSVKSGDMESMKKKLEDDGFEVSFEEDGRVVIVKEEEPSLAAWGDFDEEIEKADRESEESLKESKESLAESKESLAESKESLAESKEYLAIAKYKEEFSRTLLDTLEWMQEDEINKKEIIENLQKMKKVVYAGNLVDSEKNRKAMNSGLDTIKLMYPEEKKILDLIEEIQKKLNSYEIDPSMA